MRRRLFDLTVGLSLVLLVATVALWITSCWREIGVLRRVRDPMTGSVRLDWLSVGRSRIDSTASCYANLIEADRPRWTVLYGRLVFLEENEAYVNFYAANPGDGAAITAAGKQKWMYTVRCQCPGLLPLTHLKPGAVFGVTHRLGLVQPSQAAARQPWTLRSMWL